MEGFGRRSPSIASARTAPAQKSGSDKRFAPRRPGQLPAQVYVEGGVQGIPCVIRDMSTTGAKLEMRDGWDNPFKSSASELDRIRLVLRHDRVMYDCKITRRSEKELGVKFLSAPKPIVKMR